MLHPMNSNAINMHQPEAGVQRLHADLGTHQPPVLLEPLPEPEAEAWEDSNPAAAAWKKEAPKKSW